MFKENLRASNNIVTASVFRVPYTNIGRGTLLTRSLFVHLLFSEQIFDVSYVELIFYRMCIYIAVTTTDYTYLKVTLFDFLCDASTRNTTNPKFYLRVVKYIKKGIHLYPKIMHCKRRAKTSNKNTNFRSRVK